jgi:hypothetical protein
MRRLSSLVLVPLALGWGCNRSSDAPASDPTPGEASVVDTTVPDGAVLDATAPDGTALDAGPADSAAPDAAPADASPADTGSRDPSAQDTVAADLPPGDAAVADTGSPALMALVDAAKWSADLAVIAKPRPPGSAHWQAVQDLCAERLTSLGYTVTRPAFAGGVNVIGVLAGTSLSKESIVLSAHYDHVGDCDGADDNASGVAGVLEAARVLATTPHARTIVAACWDKEEDGLLGSSAWVADAKAKGELVTMAFVFEMIGFRATEPGSQTLPAGFELLFPNEAKLLADQGNRGDFIAAIADESAGATVQALVTHGKAAGLPVQALVIPAALKNSDIIGDLRRSDHAPFWMADYPAIQLTDTANFRNPHYHCYGGPDVPADLDPEFAADVVRAVVGAANDSAGE